MIGPKPSGEAGFTLLELLVSITIMAVLGAAMAAGVRFGINAWQAGGAQTQTLMTGRSLHSLMYGQLSTANLRLLRGPGRNAVVAFWGEPDRLRFLGSLPQVVPHGADMLLEYRLTESGALTFSWRALSDGRERETTNRPEMLLAKVDRLRFRYYGRSTQNPVASWHDSWMDRDRLPELVRVEVTPKAGEEWRVPPFVVAIETELLEG